MSASESAIDSTIPESTEQTRKPRRKELKNLTKLNGIWQFCRIVNGKRTRLSLDTRDLAVAKAKRDALTKAANQSELDRVLGRSSQPVAKIGEIFDAYRKAPTVRANATTRDRNIADLARMIRLVRGADFDVEKASSAILTKQLVKEWQSAKLAAAARACGNDLAAIEAAKRSLNSLLTHAQSLFSREARDDYGALHLAPNIGEFATALPVPARRQEEPNQLTDDFVSDLLERICALESEDRGAWAAFQLMTWGGLRNKECLYSRKSWLTPVPGGAAYKLEMKPADDFLPKGHSRAVIIPAEIAEALLPRPTLEQLFAFYASDEYAAGEDSPDLHLVPGRNFTDRHEAVYRRLNIWLKSHGVGEDAGKISYRLRKYFLKKVEEQQGILLAQAAAGHGALRTTQDHYVGKPKMSEPIRLAVAG